MGLHADDRIAGPSPRACDRHRSPRPQPPPICPPPHGHAIPPTSRRPPPNAPQDDIDDIRPPFFFSIRGSGSGSRLVPLGAVALLVLLWFWFKPHRLLSPKSAYELALEKLEKARALLREDDPMPYAVLSPKRSAPISASASRRPPPAAPRRNSCARWKPTATTPLAEHRDLLRDFLQSCDLVKFARYQPTLTELEQVQQRAYDFVTATKPVPAASAKRKVAS